MHLSSFPLVSKPTNEKEAGSVKSSPENTEKGTNDLEISFSILSYHFCKYG